MGYRWVNVAIAVLALPGLCNSFIQTFPLSEFSYSGFKLDFRDDKVPFDTPEPSRRAELRTLVQPVIQPQPVLSPTVPDFRGRKRRPGGKSTLDEVS